MTTEAYVREALMAKEMALAPFSQFKVGAVLVTPDRRVFRGCNIEISSFGLTICAERVAIFKAISEGVKKFSAIYIASDAEKFTPPCGACRQVLWELAGDIEVYMIDHRGQFQKSTMHELLPCGFDQSFFRP
ncbi:MAG: cytidine deaminase [candidate division KSB1 bacterium]|nr:cytidine deaminase [candidate division KSB1 bacterium]MDZ7318829.1 cytidine deaminase [candidate division KSB1 bacterium]MDZ7341760.1 cytidine deaminase [candidate division KSB1 bacterium]